VRICIIRIIAKTDQNTIKHDIVKLKLDFFILLFGALSKNNRFSEALIP